MGLPHEDDPEFLQVAVVTEGVQRLGLVVDEVQGDTSFVIKRLPWNIRRAQGVIGATHQGDAALALVVDPTHLFRTQNTSTREHRVKQSTTKQRPRILVADDSLTSRTLERNILVSAGYDVKVAEDGELALQALEHHDFDLLVTDVQMPKMDGFELTRRVRSHPRLARLPIVLITSLDRPEDVAEGARVGADEYIVKGQFDQEVLLKTVSRLL
jgi:two-component system chemotaxis sensor kinase CheA